MNHSELSTTAASKPLSHQTARVRLELSGATLATADEIRDITCNSDYDAVVAEALTRYLRTLTSQQS